MSRRIVIALGVSTLVVALSGSAIALAAGGTEPRRAPDRKALIAVNFVNRCDFSHRAPDDPIVAPGKPGASHDHSFVGNRTTSAFSTLATLLAGGSTCDRPGHTAAYWMPTLLADGQPVSPSSSTIYYRRATLAPVATFPTGFRMIAGDALSASPQSPLVTSWSCGPLSGVRRSTTVPTCPPGRASALRLRVTFPSCWNGRDLDAPDHKRHMAYARRGRCPSTHPVGVPAITLIFRYPPLEAQTYALASGPQTTAHADFFNAWDPAVLERLVDGCLNALRHCGRGT